MGIEIESEHLNGLIVLRTEVFEDGRGFFLESFRTDQFKDLGLPENFVQDNHSRSVKGVLRGLHFQWEPQIAKLMRVTYGSAFLVAVDIRKDSPTLGKWHGEIVSATDKKQIFAPAGFARGFCALSDFAEIQYKCTGIYNKKCESGILWNDPELGIKWPISDPLLSEKDKNAQTLAKWLARSESEYYKF